MNCSSGYHIAISKDRHNFFFFFKNSLSMKTKQINCIILNSSPRSVSRTTGQGEMHVGFKHGGDGGGGGGGGGGGDSFLACDDFGRMFDNSFPACAFFFFF